MGSDEEKKEAETEKDQSLEDLGQAFDERGRRRSAERELEDPVIDPELESEDD